MSGDVLERNLERLFRRAWRPVEPAPRFAAGLRARLEVEIGARHTAHPGPSTARAATPWRVGRLAAAAAVLLALGAAFLLWRGRDGRAEPLEDLLARGAVALQDAALAESGAWRAATERELEQGVEAGAGALAVATPAARGIGVRLGSAGRVDVAAQARAAVDRRDDEGGRAIDHAAGALRLVRDDAGAPWRIATPQGALELARGVLEVALAPEGPGGGPCALVRLLSGAAWVASEPRVALQPGQSVVLRGGALVASAAAVAPPDPTAARRETVPVAPVGDAAAGAAAAHAAPRLDGLVRAPAGAEQPAEFRVTLLRRERLPKVSRPISARFAGAPRFAFEGLEPGVYDLCVEAPPFAVALAPGLEVDAAPRAPVEIDLAPAATLRGRVLDARTGAGVAGATCLVEALVPAQILPFQVDLEEAGWLAAATTGPDGAFALPGVPVGAHRVRVSAPGLAATWSAPVNVRAAGDVEVSDLRSRPGGSVGGVVLHEDGSPWADALVVASRIDLGAVGGRMSYGFARAAPDGRYAIPDLPAGSYVVLCVDRARGQSADTTRQVTIAGTEHVELDLGPTLARTRVVGTVRGADGRPFGDADVMLQRAETADRSGGWIAERTRPDGTYVFGGVEPGLYVVYVGRGLGQSFVEVGRVEVPLQAEIVHDVRLPAGSLRGVVRGPDGAPEPGAWVIVLLEDGDARPFCARAQAGADGAFALDGFEPASYTVCAYAERPLRAPAARTGTWIGPGATTEVALQLTRGAALEVRVQDAAGRPLAGRAVRCVDPAGQAFQLTADDRTGPDGVLRIPGLAAGAWRVEVDGAEPARVELAVGESSRVTITTRP